MFHKSFHLSGSVSRITSNYFLRFLSSKADFEAAQANLKKIKDEPDAATKLKIYALFKQATAGNVTGKRPGVIDFVGRAKFDAWKSLEGMSQEDAQKKYAELVDKLLGEEVETSESETSVGDLKPVPGIRISIEGKIFRIHLNRPNKYNALTNEMYEGLIAALNYASKDRTTSVTVFSASGRYFCSGNDLSNFTRLKGPDAIPRMAKEGADILERYVNAFISHEKPLFALVNGPAIGISVTVLGLFDLVLASDKASFHTPFATLGQSPEGCSSYTFPLLMGPIKAAEVLLLSRKLTALEAYERNLVTEVFPDATFKEESEKRILEYSLLPPESLRMNKWILRESHRDALLKCNTREVKLLAERWQGQECMDAIKTFMTRKT
ncbi:hypothetical protein AB6A40_009421 [Gnathostoma spinigerum]|uniref:ACB domain-containing protein n=1 Tax=Gnathostoma spinigerum TaxID=75299 RepID=A0ABD6F0M4_9BILA